MQNNQQTGAVLPFIQETRSSWDKLKEEQRPIFIYGMGDGAIKIMTAMKSYGIPLAGIFASDEFVRGHSFEGYRVQKPSEVEEAVEDFVIVLAFAAGFQSLVDKIVALSQKHTLIVPDVPVTGGGLFTYEYCLEHAEELQQVYDLLADDASRKVYAGILNFKISGNIDYLTPATTPKAEIYKELIRPTTNEIFVDLGAYNGDSIRELLEFSRGKFNRIIAFEPDKKNFKKLTKFIGHTPAIDAYNCVAWCVDTELPFATKAGRQSAISSDGNMTQARSVDSILDGERATIIKMDVEGAEREAIWGASRTIARYSPRLMVSLYHRNEDIFELPLLIQRINPKYKLYIRHQLYIPAWETNLYATVE